MPQGCPINQIKVGEINDVPKQLQERGWTVVLREKSVTFREEEVTLSQKQALLLQGIDERAI